jgi:hypothetical protein
MEIDPPTLDDHHQSQISPPPPRPSQIQQQVVAQPTISAAEAANVDFTSRDDADWNTDSFWDNLDS